MYRTSDVKNDEDSKINEKPEPIQPQLVTPKFGDDYEWQNIEYHKNNESDDSGLPESASDDDSSSDDE